MIRGYEVPQLRSSSLVSHRYKLASASLESKLQEVLGTALPKSIFVPRMHLFTWIPRSQCTGRETVSVFFMWIAWIVLTPLRPCGDFIYYQVLIHRNSALYPQSVCLLFSWISEQDYFRVQN